MSGRTSLEIKKEILIVLQDGKSHSYAELERKVNSNWQTIRVHCKELEIFGSIKIKHKESHEKNNKPYFEVTMTKQGRLVFGRI